MRKQAIGGAVGVAGIAALSGWLWWNSDPPRAKWPECRGLPDKLRAVKGNDGVWRAVIVNARPKNAPCWVEYTPRAVDNKGAVGVGPAVRIYVER